MRGFRGGNKDIPPTHTPDYQATYQQLNYYESPTIKMGENSVGQKLFDNAVAGTRHWTNEVLDLISKPTGAIRVRNVAEADEFLHRSGQAEEFCRAPVFRSFRFFPVIRSCWNLTLYIVWLNVHENLI